MKCLGMTITYDELTHLLQIFRDQMSLLSYRHICAIAGDLA